MAAKPKRIGEILIDEGLITPEQRDKALEEGGRRIGKTLVKLGYVTEEQIAKALAHQFNLRYLSLKDLRIPRNVLDAVPQYLARKHTAIPISISRSGRTVVVAMADPLNVLAVDELRRHTNLGIQLVISTEEEINIAIAKHYVAVKSIEEMVESEDVDSLELIEGEAEAEDKLKRIADESSVVRIVDTVLAKAFEQKASDIHLEPDFNTLRVRFRIDGILGDAANLPMKLHPAVTSRIKILSNMDIAEKRRPQDGSFVMRTGGRGGTDVRISSIHYESSSWDKGLRREGDREVDVRTSTIPVKFGEKIVMRLLDKEAMISSLDQLSPSADSLEVLKFLIRRPYGIVLITGPTGSGKTTTIYDLLGQLNTVELNVITVEDPVEYQIGRVSQVQVDPRAGITFAGALRHILRQDPDVIMVGEIRDRETAEIAFHAALTGHLVLSTLHTNDAAGTIGRLLDMGVEPFMVSSAIIGIASQRLVRKICPDCKEPYQVEDTLLRDLGLPGGTMFYHGRGCESCNGKGYSGRTAIIEVIRMGDVLKKLTLEKADSATIRSRMRELGFQTLREEGIKAVKAGITTLEEVLRTTQDIEEM